MSSDTYTPEPVAWSFTVAPNSSAELHQQAALEFLVATLATEHHAALHDLVGTLREQADETRYHDPSVGIVGNAGAATALDALANLLAAECHRSDLGNIHRGAAL